VNDSQKLFLAISIIGGIAVIVSYIWGFKSGINLDNFWGGVPENLRGIYTISMLLSAAGFFVFFLYILSNLDGQNSFVPPNFMGDKAFHILFTLILVFSTVWMPLVAVMISSPSTLIWVGIRAGLAIVGLASLGVLILLLSLNPRPTDAFYVSALIGISWFTIHTGILDAIIWAGMWK